MFVQQRVVPLAETVVSVKAFRSIQAWWKAPISTDGCYLRLKAWIAPEEAVQLVPPHRLAFGETIPFHQKPKVAKSWPERKMVRTSPSWGESWSSLLYCAERFKSHSGRSEAMDKDCTLLRSGGYLKKQILSTNPSQMKKAKTDSWLRCSGADKQPLFKWRSSFKWLITEPPCYIYHKLFFICRARGSCSHGQVFIFTQVVR